MPRRTTVRACQPSIDPVSCSSNGITYGNHCLADCDGATGCTPLYACQPEIDPVVCSSNGFTYNNQCLADADGADGLCLGGSACSRELTRSHARTAGPTTTSALPTAMARRVCPGLRLLALF